MKKLLLLFFLITLCACSDLLSKDYLVPEQYRIHEGVVCEHEQTVLFPQKDGTAIEVRLGEPVIVAMAEEAYKWGFFQFPSIFRTADGTLMVHWQMREDSAKAYGQKPVGKHTMMSKDNGKTWIDNDGSYDTEWYSYALKDGEAYLSLYIPAPTEISGIVHFPQAIDEVLHYGEKYQFYRDADLPEELSGIYIRKWTDIHADANQIQVFHARFHDNGLCRYATDGQMSILWNGEFRKRRNGDVVGCNYRGFYLDANGKILPSGISFYRWNEANVSLDLLGKIPYQPDLYADPYGDERKVWGFTEPAFIERADGTLVCVVRSSEQAFLSPMYRTLSTDGGKTWSQPVPFTPNGVKPQLLELGNGTLVLSSGRPGVQLRFNFDGTAENWTEPIDMLPFMIDERNYIRDASCGYTGLLPVDENTFLMVYSDFYEQDKQGNTRKAIKVREIVINHNVVL